MEFEARLRVSPDIFLKALEKAKKELKFVKETIQEDYYFGSIELIEKARREKIADSFLIRIRKEESKLKVQLKGDTGIWDRGHSVYFEKELKVCDDFNNIISFFRGMGLELVVVVKKRRLIFENEHLYVNFDDVENLGKFIEIEAKTDEDEERIEEFIKQFGIIGRHSKGYVTQLVKGTKWEKYIRG